MPHNQLSGLSFASRFSNGFSGLSFEQEFLLTSWSNYCAEQKTLHDLSWAYYRKMNLTTSIIAILLSSFTGISIITLTPINSNCDDDDKNTINIASYVIGVCGVISGALMAINTFAKFSEYQEQHSLFCDNYEILCNDINFNSSIFMTNETVFKSPIEFVKYCRYKLNNIIDKSPNIPLHIRKKFGKKMNKMLIPNVFCRSPGLSHPTSSDGSKNNSHEESSKRRNQIRKSASFHDFQSLGLQNSFSVKKK